MRLRFRNLSDRFLTMPLTLSTAPDTSSTGLMHRTCVHLLDFQLKFRAECDILVSFYPWTGAKRYYVANIFFNGTTSSTYGAHDIAGARSGSRSAQIALKTPAIERSHFFTSKLYPTFFFNSEKIFFFEIEKKISEKNLKNQNLVEKIDFSK